MGTNQSIGSVILVHGAWANGSSWDKVIPALVAEGLTVTAIQLPLTSFEEDVACLRRALALADAPAVLVGHSYGGAVITEAGTDDRVAGLVYVAAFAPDAGESAASLGETVPDPAPLTADIRPDAEGFLKLTEDGIRRSFAQDASDAEQVLLYATQTPTAGVAFGGTISAPAWRSKPAWYLVASEDRAIQPELERRMAARMGAQVVEVASSHAAMISHPEETTALILDAVRGA